MPSFCFVASSAFAQVAVEKGKQVYTAQKCSVCHSIAGVGNKKGPLDKVGTKLSADDIRAWIVDAPGDGGQGQGRPEAADEGVHDPGQGGSSMRSSPTCSR